MIFLLIKGDRQDALTAAVQRGIPISVQSSSVVETKAEADSAHLEVVKEWFLEDVATRPPFQPGALLHYSVRGNAR